MTTLASNICQMAMFWDNFPWHMLGQSKGNSIYSLRHPASPLFVCLDMQPVSVVEGIGFCKLLHTLEPRFQVPSRNHQSSTEIPHWYNQEVKSLKSELFK